MPTKLHAIADYLIALLSILSPLIFGFGEGSTETLIPICFGLLIILYSFFSDYELGLSREIPLYVHFRMDQLGGLMMAASPWLLNFEEMVYLPHVLLGLALIVNALLAGNEINSVIQFFRQRQWEKWFQLASEKA
jgi:hypothetical protein